MRRNLRNLPFCPPGLVVEAEKQRARITRGRLDRFRGSIDRPGFDGQAVVKRQQQAVDARRDQLRLPMGQLQHGRRDLAVTQTGGDRRAGLVERAVRRDDPERVQQTA